MRHVHLDTDFGGDPDDLIALTMLLGMPDIRVTGITTCLDRHGQRAAYLQHVLEMLGRTDIPLSAGAKVSMTKYEPADPIISDERYWPDIPPLAAAPGDSVQRLERSMWMRSDLIVIGPYTNAAMFERMRAGLYRERRIYLMGGWLDAPADDLPQWSLADDFNVQWDTRALEEVFKSFAHLTIVPTPTAMRATLTERDLPRLRASGPVGELIANQLRAWADDQSMREVGRANDGLPDDLLNFMWDPLTVAAACQWEGIQRESRQLMPYLEGGLMHYEESEDGREIEIVTGFDAEAFHELLLTAIERAQSRN